MLNILSGFTLVLLESFIALDMHSGLLSQHRGSERRPFSVPKTKNILSGGYLAALQKLSNQANPKHHMLSNSGCGQSIRSCRRPSSCRRPEGGLKIISKASPAVFTANFHSEWSNAKWSIGSIVRGTQSFTAGA